VIRLNDNTLVTYTEDNLPDVNNEGFSILQDWLTNLGNAFRNDSVDITNGRGGHIISNHASGTGKPGKTEFPADWSDQDIISAVSDVTTNPISTKGVDPRGTPYADGIVNGVDIRVTFFPEGHPREGKISSAYPTNVPPNQR
jgi:hypothetical protein